VPFNAVKASVDGHAPEIIPSMASGLLQASRHSQDPEGDERVAREVSATSFAGGSDTTTSSFATFFIAMALHPDVQKKAQVELDSVLGRNRLPDFSDRPALPYIEAICKEVERWLPIVPLGVAHASVKEDTYKGYRIPANSVMIPNTWFILHDERNYREPHKFDPDRFLNNGKLDPNVLDPGKFAFGNGRRICPGKQMAENSVFIAIASILACFTIEHRMDKDGRPIPIKVDMTQGFPSHPKPFDCSVKPRNQSIRSLIAQSIREEED